MYSFNISSFWLDDDDCQTIGWIFGLLTSTDGTELGKITRRRIVRTDPEGREINGEKFKFPSSNRR